MTCSHSHKHTRAVLLAVVRVLISLRRQRWRNICCSTRLSYRALSRATRIRTGNQQTKCSSACIRRRHSVLATRVDESFPTFRLGAGIGTRQVRCTPAGIRPYRSDCNRFNTPDPVVRFQLTGRAGHEKVGTPERIRTLIDPSTACCLEGSAGTAAKFWWAV